MREAGEIHEMGVGPQQVLIIQEKS
jgi:hypothetical protein